MTIQTVSNLKEFFRDALHDALSHQHVAVEDQTEHYVVNLLTLFSDADALFERDARDPEQRSRLKPLVVRLGDVSLFIAGFFSAGFTRKLVDIDYHIAMGGRAYGTLAENCGPARGRTLRQVFAELAAKFTPMVDALNEISESSYQHSDRDRLRLYELWVKTGSERSRTLLRKLGVEPAPAARSVLAH